MFMRNSGIGRAAAALLLCMAAASPAQAAFPERPVKLVVPYTPGAADLLSQELAQPVVVENKPGANTMIAATQVARAQPDGYTLFLASNASMVLNPMLYRKISYDAQRDFRVLSVAELPLVVVANNSVPASTLAQFVDYARARPGKLNYASVGIGNPLQLATELLKSRTGIDVAHVPYNGSAGIEFADGQRHPADGGRHQHVIAAGSREQDQGPGRDRRPAAAGAA
ncbi:Tripartite tricarboxylate transporter family receptor [Achromobacter xylosoxidans]|nr:Tripartite tricarboxylate transporter family receptor [Achromobacter xylosoxidans]